MNISYEKEVESFLKELFYSTWMDDTDWEEFLTESNISLKELSNDIQTGINNGHSLEEQLKLLRSIFIKR